MSGYIFNIFKFNLLTFFPFLRSKFYNKEFYVSGLNSGQACSCYCGIVLHGKFFWGLKGNAVGNAALVLFGLPVMIAADIILVKTGNLYIEIACDVVCGFICLVKFDAITRRYNETLLKLGFLTASILSKPLWTIVYIIYILFENILHLGFI